MVRGESIGVGEHVSGCCGRGRRSETSGRYPAKAFAVFSIFALLAVIIIPMIEGPEVSGDFTDDDYYITYKPGSIEGLIDSQSIYNHFPVENNSYTDVIVKYDGVSIAEYNPQFWSTGSDTEGNSISGHATIVSKNFENWYGIKQYVPDSTIVFSGWVCETTDDVIDPGDEIQSDLFENDENGKRTLTLTAKWTYLESVERISGNIQGNDGRLHGAPLNS